MNVVIYVVATTVGLLLSSIGVVFALLSGLQFALLIGGLLAVAHIGSFLFVRRKAAQGKGRQAAIVLALPIFLVGGVMYVLGVAYALLMNDSF